MFSLKQRYEKIVTFNTSLMKMFEVLHVTTNCNTPKLIVWSVLCFFFILLLQIMIELCFK